MPANMSDQKSVINQRRHSRSVEGRSVRVLFREFAPPLQLARARVMSGEDAGDAKGVNRPVAHDGRRLWTFAMTSRGWIHLIRDWLARSPNLLAGHGVQAKQNLVLALSRKHVDPALRLDWRSVSDTYHDLPFFFQCPGPHLRNKGAGYHAITI